MLENHFFKRFKRHFLVTLLSGCLSFAAFAGSSPGMHAGPSEKKSHHKHKAAAHKGALGRRLSAFHHHLTRVFVHITPPFRSYHILHINPVASTENFDAGWLFKLDSTGEYAASSVPDSLWRKLNLPHDWSIEDLSPATQGPFTSKSIGATATGFTVGGTAWYRKHFISGDYGLGRQTVLEFEGVYMNAEFWCNGHLLASHHNGYTPFLLDLSSVMNAPGKDNVLAVRVRNTGKNSRWYSGSGIYRHVWMHSMPSLHIAPDGLQVIQKRADAGEGLLQLKTLIRNRGRRVLSAVLTASITDSAGHTLASVDSHVTVGARRDFPTQSLLDFERPVLWSPEHPYLYTVHLRLVSGETVLDEYKQLVGLRTLSFSSGSGFLLNGKSIKLKGACVHHDNGILGAAAYDLAEERKVLLLKQAGFNAIRTSHNTPSRAFLDACDREGMLVVEEFSDLWEKAKNPDDYHLYFKSDWKADFDAMLARDRNHPGVILWSIGNEIPERAQPAGLKIGRMLAVEAKRMDSSRLVTMAVNDFWDYRGIPWDKTAPTFENLGVGGYNYAWRHYASDHKLYPGRVMMGTESFPMEAGSNWNAVIANPCVIGDFVWTAMDYLGETGIGHTSLSGEKNDFLSPYPTYNAWCGDIDLTGNKKPQGLYRAVLWNQSKIQILVHRPLPAGKKELVSSWGWPDELDSWNWDAKPGTPMQVNVYSSYPAVRLKLNGRTLSDARLADTSHLTARFTVPYSAGVLEAVGLVDGREVESIKLSSTGKPAAIRILVDPLKYKGPKDLIYLNIEVTDQSGQRVPDAVVPLIFKAEGEMSLAAFGNAAFDDVSSFQNAMHRTFRGRAQLILHSGAHGKITVTSPGLQQAELVLP